MIKKNTLYLVVGNGNITDDDDFVNHIFEVGEALVEVAYNDLNGAPLFSDGNRIQYVSVEHLVEIGKI